MENAYNTTDPQKLLQLKRLEADSLLDVLRTINMADLTIDKLCRIARNVLRAQLGVKKMLFIYLAEENWLTGIQSGLTLPKSDQARALMTITRTSAAPSVLVETGAEYVIPITSRGEPKAFFVVADFADTEVERENDLIFIETLGNILYVAIENKLLFQEKVRQEYLKKELEVAETIQQQLLISDFRRFTNIDVHALNIPHHGIGGDFYDVIQIGQHRTFVCIADVSGKGIGAALLMSNLQANLRSLCAQYDDPKTIVQQLNYLLFQITGGEKFVSLFLALIETDNQQFTFVNAGHNYPVFIQKGKVWELSTGCLLLGILPEVDIESATLSYYPEDILFAFTDGIEEQVNTSGDMFGSHKITQTLLANQELNSEEIVYHLLRQLNDYSSDSGVSDDITMLNVKFLPE
ncbi:MAG: PP2C family protein-serine/threonine phosphatase [Bacteroidota bacterium]